MSAVLILVENFGIAHRVARLRRAVAVLIVGCAIAPIAAAAGLPGVGLHPIAVANGFVTSLAIDPAGRLCYSTTDGSIWRIDGTGSALVAKVDTASIGNTALLGIAFDADGSIVAHYVRPDLLGDVVARIDPTTANVTVIAELLCGGKGPCPTEHHGGNLIVTPDGSIFVGIGDLGGQSTAQRDDSVGGKIFRIDPEGEVERWALGFRNPFDLAWSPSTESMFVSDNGSGPTDEINELVEGGNYGWPLTLGDGPPVEGTIPPIYTFPVVVAPTGMCSLGGSTPVLRRGLLVTTYVTGAIEWFPSLVERPLEPPVTLVEADGEPMIDVVEADDGTIYCATTSAIWSVALPGSGDVDGDGDVDVADLVMLRAELFDGDGSDAARVAESAPQSTLGADVDGDGLVDRDDFEMLLHRLVTRRRGARRR